MINNDFYIFGSKLSSDTVQVHMSTVMNQKNGITDGFDIQLLKGEFDNWHFPIIFKLAHGKNLKDILDTGTASLCLISEKVKNIFEANNLTGWKTFEVKIFDKEDKIIHGYFGLSIVGRSGRIKFDKSNIIKKQLVQNGSFANYYKGFYFDIQNWDGSDFFLAENYFGTLISSRAAEILNKNGFSNVKIRDIKTIEMDEFTVSNIQN